MYDTRLGTNGTVQCVYDEEAMNEWTNEWYNAIEMLALTDDNLITRVFIVYVNYICWVGVCL